MLSEVQKNRYARLLDALRAMERVLVAFSGGVDSSLLLHAAHEALPGGVLAVSLVTPYTPKGEAREALALARALGVEHHVVELPVPEELRSNPPERCYLCKRILFGRLVEMAGAAGIGHVLDGSNVDDLGDYRPGRRAAVELGVQSPLLDAGMTKQDIRDISRACGLPTWNRPAGACLLTRLPHGAAVDEAELARIDEGESFLKELGFAAVRLRSHGDVARIEVPRDALAAVLEADADRAITARLKELGYRHVALDLDGYRMGSLNPPAGQDL
jgi:uncharacterized protein